MRDDLFSRSRAWMSEDGWFSGPFFFSFSWDQRPRSPGIADCEIRPERWRLSGGRLQESISRNQSATIPASADRQGEISCPSFLLGQSEQSPKSKAQSLVLWAASTCRFHRLMRFSMGAGVLAKSDLTCSRLTHRDPTAGIGRPGEAATPNWTVRTKRR